MKFAFVRLITVWHCLVFMQALALTLLGAATATTEENSLKGLNPFESSVSAQELAPKEQVRMELKRGAKLYRDGRWAEAIKVWEQVLELDPNNNKAKRYIERAQKKISQEKISTQPTTKPTLPTPEEKVSPKPAERPVPTREVPKKQIVEDVASWLNQGISLYRDGKYSEAISYWNKVLTKEPENERAKRYIQRALKKQSQVSELPPTTEKAPVEKESETEVKQLLEEGKKLYRNGKFAEAILKWEKVVELDSMNLAAKRYIKRAKEKLAEAQKIKPLPLPTPKAKKEIEPITPTPLAPLPTPPTRKPFVSEPIKIPTALPSAPLPLGVRKPVPKEGKILDYGVLNLEESIKLGLFNHGPAKVAREEIKLAKMRLLESRRASFPGVNLKNGITEGVSTDEDFEGLEFTAEFQLPIMTGGRLKNAIRQSEANVAVAIRNYEKVRADFVAEIEQAFYGLSNAKKSYRDRLELFNVASSALDLIRKLFDIGLGRQLDVLNIENQYNDISFQITSGGKDLELAYLTLSQLMNLEENETFEIQELKSYVIIDIDFDETLALALKRRSDIRLSELQVLFNKFAVKVAESQNRFKVEMNASIGLNDQFFVESEKLNLQTEFFVGIKATKPLGMHVIENNFIIQDRVPAAGQTTSSQFGSNTMSLALFNNTAPTSITEAKIQYMRAKVELKKSKKTTRFEVQQNFFEYQKALAQLDGASTRLKLGQEEVKILKAQALLNQAQLLDVLRAQIRKYDAFGTLNQAITSYYTSLSNLNKAIGISGYFNPVTGEVSEKLYRDLFKPINKPRYKIFTQLTKDKPKEDIMNFPIEKVNAETLLEKERRKERAFSDKFLILAPLKVIPGLSEAVTPKETHNEFLKNIDLAPDEPLKPFKPWQLLRWPLFGFFEYETIMDADESTGPEPEVIEAPAKETSSNEVPTNKETRTKPAIQSTPPEIASVEFVDEADKVSVILINKGGIDLASFLLEDPARVIFVLKTPALPNDDLKDVLFPTDLVKGIRFHKLENKIDAFVIDLSQATSYDILVQPNELIVAIKKPVQNSE